MSEQKFIGRLREMEFAARVLPPRPPWEARRCSRCVGKSTSKITVNVPADRWREFWREVLRRLEEEKKHGAA